MGLKTVMSVAVALALSSTALAQSTFQPTNNVVTDRASLGIGTTFVELDLSSAGFLDNAVNFGNNGWTQNFVGNMGNFSGNLTVEVFGNQSSLGAGLNDVILVYTFLGSGISPVGSETFAFGVDSSRELDFGTLKAATHGNISDDNQLQPGQGDPTVQLNDNVGANDTMFFNYMDGSGTSTGELGGQISGTEIYTWYIQASGDVKLNFVDVFITDFGGVTIETMSLVTDADTPNLGTPPIPLPTAAGMGFVGLGLLTMRRRR